MIMKLKDLKRQKYYQRYLQKKNLSRKTLKSYNTALLHFCNANNKTFDEIITETIEEQYPYIDDKGRIHEYNPNHANIDTYLYNTVNYLRERDNSNTSISSTLSRIRAVLSTLDIKLPKNIELEDDTREWHVLSKKDIQYVVSVSPLYYQALIVFLAHTGIRLGDALSFTIQDFMEATYNYHKCNEIDEFLEKAPEDMMGYWDFTPSKTRKHSIECKVYNTGESSNLILKSLHHRSERIMKLNEKHGLNLKLEKQDALFTSNKNTQFKNPILADSVTIFFIYKNKAFHHYRKRLLLQDLENGKISQETFESMLDEIPKFHAHGLRKFFITTLARKRVDLRASALMEGHKAPMQHDSSYVDNTNLDDLLFEEYQRIIPAISFSKSEEDFELGKKNHELMIENRELKEKAASLEDENRKIKQTVDNRISEVFEEFGISDILRRHGR